eukprot:GHVH01002205.1.p1 GENE.GHVH01002205.1~~GHVH01002205.1.p1  ORF type:complete len:749 (+),score=96.16 GHVH01002205.1:56-2302(+)
MSYILRLGVVLLAKLTYASESFVNVYDDDEPVPEPWWSISRVDSQEKSMVIAPQYYSLGGTTPLGALVHGKTNRCSEPRNVEMILVTDNQDSRYGRLMCTWDPPADCDGDYAGCFGVYIHAPGVRWGNRSLLPHEVDGSRPTSPNKFNGRGFMYRNLSVNGPPGQSTCQDGYLCVEEYMGKYAFTLPLTRFNWSFGGRLHYPSGDSTKVDDPIAQGGPENWNYQNQPNDIPFYSEDDLPDSDNFWPPRQSAPPSSMEVMECWVMANSYNSGEWPPPSYDLKDTIPSDRTTARCGQYEYDIDSSSENPVIMAGREGYMSLGHHDVDWSDWSPKFPKTGEVSVAGHERIAKHSFDTRVTGPFSNPARGAWNRYVMDLYVDPTYQFSDPDYDLGPEGMIWKLHWDKVTQNWCQKGVELLDQSTNPEASPQSYLPSEEEGEVPHWSSDENDACKRWYMRQMLKRMRDEPLDLKDALPPKPAVEGFRRWITAWSKVERSEEEKIKASKLIKYVNQNLAPLFEKAARVAKDEAIRNDVSQIIDQLSTTTRQTTQSEQILEAATSVYEPQAAKHDIYIDVTATTGAKGLLNTHNQTGNWPPGLDGNTLPVFPSPSDITGFRTSAKGPFFNPPTVDFTLTVDPHREWTTLPAFEHGDDSMQFKPSPLPYMDPQDIVNTYELRRPIEELMFWHPRPATFYDGAYIGAECDSPWNLCDLQGDSQRVLYQSDVRHMNSCDWRQLHAAPESVVTKCAEVP